MQGTKTPNINQEKRQTSIDKSTLQSTAINDYSMYNYSAKNGVSKNIPTVAELVRGVNTIEDFEKFDKKHEEIDRNFGKDYSNKQNEKLYLLYENAADKIDKKLSDKIFYFQYLPEIDLETSNKDLLNAFEICTSEQYKVKKKENSNSWEEIDGSELMQGKKIEEYLLKKTDYFDVLVQFRKIVESNLTLNPGCIIFENPCIIRQ